ncbi:MAG: HEAT repeat domain-containing protein [Gemmataceae bacterium]
MVRRLLVIPIVLVALATPVSAGFFSKKAKPNPTERVPELLTLLKTSPDESKRREAADELKEYDPKSFPEILPALIDALGKDASTSVRSEAASSIARIRPISQQAGYALEQSQSNDPSMRVRMSARQALLQYNLVGYRGGKPPEQPGDKAATTPNAAASAPPAARPQPPLAIAGKGMPPRGQFPETAEPPLADPPSQPNVVATPVSRPRTLTPLPAQPGMQPLPGGPVPNSANVPAVPPVPSTAPSKTGDADGPSLPSPF